MHLTYIHKAHIYTQGTDIYARHTYIHKAQIYT